MPSESNLGSLRELQSDIETFLRTVEHPIVIEDEVELFDLTAAKWELKIEFGKLIFEAWNPARSIVRRVEEIAYRDRARMGLFVRKPGARETGTLEFRTLGRSEQFGRASERAHSRQQLLGVLNRKFPGWRFERVSNRSDREHSFSGWYTRGCARRGGTAWAFLGLGENEAPAAADAVLGFGLIWLDWLRSHADRITIPGLKLFVPGHAIEVIAHRAACLNRRAIQVEILEWRASEFRPIDLKDFGNVETSLVPRRQGEALLQRHREAVRQWAGDLADRVDLVPDASATFLSLRVLGLEVARVEGQITPRIYSGLEGSCRFLQEDHRQEFFDFLQRVLELRAANSPDPHHEYFRLQSERWLESLLVRDVTKIDPALVPSCVYPQVPAFAGSERGVIDILSVTRAGRLAVIELKLHEEINLPLQGLDYWLRVKWLSNRGQFHAAGYFPGIELAPSPPLLYLVSPAFRFHSSTDRILRYLDPSIHVIQVGLNDHWREGVQVLFRREDATLG